MINMLRKGIKFSIQRVYFPQSYFESRHYGKRFNSIGKFKSLTFQLRAIYFHTFAVDMSVYDRNFMRHLYECKFQAGFITAFVKDWKNPMCIIVDLHGSCAVVIMKLHTCKKR